MQAIETFVKLGFLKCECEIDLHLALKCSNNYHFGKKFQYHNYTITMYQATEKGHTYENAYITVTVLCKEICTIES